MADLVVGTTVAPFKAVDKEDVQWLEGAVALSQNAKSAGFDNVHFMAALEVDARGASVYEPLLQILSDLDGLDGVSGTSWKFAMDDGETVINPINRLIRICTGRNLVQEFMLRNKAASHLLFVDSDLVIPSDSVSRLLEVDADIVGGDVPSYCLGGPPKYDYPFPVQEHWNTAGFILIRRDVVRHIRWRSDVHDTGTSDDPCYASDAKMMGFSPTLVRKDVIGRHKPLRGLEQRGHDLRIVR